MAKQMDVKKKKSHHMHINLDSYHCEALLELHRLLGCKDFNKTVYKAIHATLKAEREKLYAKSA